jgi:hypothetical protein
MFAENAQVAVADNFIASWAPTAYQFMPGRVLRGLGFDVDDENAMYVYKAQEEMVWPYDDRGRLIGEDVWEIDPAKAEIIKLDPADVITPHEAAERLAPLIQPLPRSTRRSPDTRRSRGHAPVSERWSRGSGPKEPPKGWRPPPAAAGRANR